MTRWVFVFEEDEMDRGYLVGSGHLPALAYATAIQLSVLSAGRPKALFLVFTDTFLGHHFYLHGWYAHPVALRVLLTGFSSGIAKLSYSLRRVSILPGCARLLF